MNFSVEVTLDLSSRDVKVNTVVFDILGTPIGDPIFCAKSIVEKKINDAVRQSFSDSMSIDLSDLV